MTRNIDDRYWKDYYDTHNERKFESLVKLFYTDDAIFENPKVHAVGQKQILQFFRNSNKDAHIELVPRTIITNPNVTATELDCIIHPLKDMPNFLLGPVKKGDEVTIRMAAIYHLTDELICQARIYWGKTAE